MIFHGLIQMELNTFSKDQGEFYFKGCVCVIYKQIFRFLPSWDICNEDKMGQELFGLND